MTTEETIIRPNSLSPSIRGQSQTEGEDVPLFDQFMIEDQNLKSVLEKVKIWMISTAQKNANPHGISQPSVNRKLKKYQDQLTKDLNLFIAFS